MSQKRQPDDDKVESGGSNAPDEKRQRVPSLKSVIIEATKQNAFQKFCLALEPLLRKVVKEEVESALVNHLACKKRHCGKQLYPSTSRSLRLIFTKKLSLPIFTGTKIEGEDCSALNIALLDGVTGEVVTSGPESSINVEIVVLEGDFEGDRNENWPFEEFQDNVVKQRDGRRPLLTGDVVLNLSKGSGILGELLFTDNSSWTRSRKFRLGARVAGGFFGDTRIMEAKTEAFVVKDHRGELYKKHYPPSLTDEVWRLEKIGKDGAFHKRLSSENINTVKDFLTLLCVDAQRLRSILGNGMSAKMWELTVDHARTCNVNGHTFVYYPNSQQRTEGVVFNIVGEVMGLLSREQYIPCIELSEIQQADALKLVKSAFEHWNDVVSYKNEDVAGSSSHAPAAAFPSDALTTKNLHTNFLSYQKSAGLNIDQPNISSPDIISSIQSLSSLCSSDDFALHGICNMDFRQECASQIFPRHDIYKDSRGLCKIFEMESLSQSFFSEDPLRFFDSEPSFSQNIGLESQEDYGSCFIATPLQTSATSDKAHTKWMMLKAVLQWTFSIKRIVEKKKKNRLREMETYN